MNPTRKDLRMNLDAYFVALVMIRALKPVLARVQTHDAALATQIRKAAASVPLNLSEGRRRVGKDRSHHWRIAAGSADEVRACLHVAAAWDYLEACEIEPALALLDRVLAMLWRLKH
jgi:four helix bundle protein